MTTLDKFQEMDEQQEDTLEKFQALQHQIGSHDAKFQQIEEFQRSMIEEVQALKGLFNQRDEKLTEQLQLQDEKLTEQLQLQDEKLAEQLQSQTEFQIKLSKQFDDHRSYITKELVRMYKFSTKVHEQNASLEQERDQKSSSSSGCCSFLRHLGTTPAAAPAVAVVPGSVWNSTAAPMLPSQLLAEQQQLIAELQRKMTQLEATTSTGGSSGSEGLGKP